MIELICKVGAIVFTSCGYLWLAYEFGYHKEFIKASGIFKENLENNNVKKGS